MEERVALVTGGTRGIGFGCAETLAREGWKLAVCGVRKESEARESLQKLREAAGEVLYVQADIGEDDAPDRLVSAVRARFGRLDLLVNNKSIGRGAAVKVGENFGIKITGIGSVKEVIRTLGGA